MTSVLVTPGSPATRAAGPVASHPPRHPATRPGASGQRHPAGVTRLALAFGSARARPPAPSRRPAACKSLLERLPKVLLPSSLPGLPTLPAKVCYRPVPTGQPYDAALLCSLLRPKQKFTAVLQVRENRCARRAAWEEGAGPRGSENRAPSSRGSRGSRGSPRRRGRPTDNDHYRSLVSSLAALATLPSLPRRRPGLRLLTRQQVPRDRSRFTSRRAARSRRPVLLTHQQGPAASALYRDKARRLAAH